MAITVSLSAFQYVGPLTSTSTALTITSVGDYLFSSTNGAIVTLPLASSVSWAQPIGIIDAAGTAATNNITINPSSNDTIMGLASITIGTNFGGVQLWPKGGGGFWYSK